MELAAARALFPALEQVTWLNWATMPPGCLPVLDALRVALDGWQAGTHDWQVWEAEAERTREQFGRLIGAPADSISLQPSLSHAAATVAATLPPGHIVVGAREFRSNFYPWLARQELGWDVVEVPDVDGVVSTEALLNAVDERTTLVAVTEVQSSNGYRVDLDAMAAHCRSVGARLFVNLTQSLGALRFDVAAVRPDYAAAHGYKWLLAPRGAAWLYVAPERLAEARPLAANWKTPSQPYAEYYGGPYDLAPTARKLDTSLAWLSWVGARAALDLLLALDPAAAEAHCLHLAQRFRQGAQALGYRLIPEGRPSQVVGVALPDADALRAQLEAQRVIAAVRAGFLRVGFHAFNDEPDVDAALAALTTLARR